MESSGEYGTTTHNKVFDETCDVSKWDSHAFEARKRDLARTGFQVVPALTATGATAYLVRGQRTRRFATEAEAVTWAWRNWNFRLGKPMPEDEE